MKFEKDLVVLVSPGNQPLLTKTHLSILPIDLVIFRLLKY